MTLSFKCAGALVLAAFTCSLLPVAGIAGDAPPELETTVDDAIRPLMQKHDVPGMAVAVTVAGRQYFFTYGVASQESGTPVTKDTLFELGSISKTFTATLVSYAQETGKLSLQDSPGKYMPQLGGSAIDKASLLHLGTYTPGGLPLQFPGGVHNDRQMVDFFRSWTPTAAPGTVRRYSNPSIGLMGHVTGLAMGSDFATAAETELFPRLGLTHTYVRVPAREEANYAWGYKKGKPIRVTPGMFDAEAYGVKSSAVDMIRFVEANIDPQGLEATMRRAVQGTHVGYFQVAEMVQGLGWEQYPYPVSLDRLLAGNSNDIAFKANNAMRLDPPALPSGPTLFNKTGSTNGFGGYVAFVPEKEIGIVMLANRNFPIPDRVAAAHAILQYLERSQD